MSHQPLLLILVVAGYANAFAQQPLPNDLQPLSGEVRLRYVPNHEASCIKKKHDKAPGDFFGTRSSDNIAVGIFLDANKKQKFSITQKFAEGDFLRVTLDMDDSGTKFSDTDAVFDSSKNVPPQVATMLTEMLSRLTKSSSTLFGMGEPLRQGTRVSSLACALFPGGIERSTSGSYAVAGVSQIRGRRSIVMSGQQEVTCLSNIGTFKINAKGWHAIDEISGIPIANSLVGEISAPQGLATSTEDMECSISGNPISTQGSAPNGRTRQTAEQRLTELKSLLEKGLITPSQFEMKRQEILQGL